MKVQVTKTIKNVVKMRYENGILKVVANCFVSNRRLRKIIEENAEWIETQKREYATASVVKIDDELRSDKNELPSRLQSSDTTSDKLVRDILAGRKTVFMGDVVDVESSANSKTFMENNTLYISEKCYQIRDSRLKAIKNYLKKMTLLYVSGEISQFGSNVSLCPARIEFRDTGDFWVKCSLAAQKILSMDFRIVQLPQNLRIYLIAHAFAHFSHPIHDDKFWNYVSNVIPRYRDCAKQLEQYQFLKNI